MRGLHKLYFLLDLCFFSAFAQDGFSELTERQMNKVIRKAKQVVGAVKPSALRLTFHDCVGGCDGCININDPDNAGLEDIVADLEEVYQNEEFYDIISRADMWALMGIWSIEETITQNNDDCAFYGPDGTEAHPDGISFDHCEMVPDLSVTFQWGRQDCATAPYSTDIVGLPSGTLAHEGLMDFFSTEFGFTSREVTALMGAHTIGAADIKNSGFHGTWINFEQGYFNNMYYVHMSNTSLNWRQLQRLCDNLVGVDGCSEGEVTGWQWSVAATAFNLNPDMALYKDFTVNSEGEPSCSYSTCSLASTATDVEEFAASNTAWIEEFSAVFTKMLQHGYDSLNDVS